MKKSLRILAIVLCLCILPSGVFATTAEPSQNSDIILTGSSGVIVYKIQHRLLDLDYFSFKATGSYGSMTRAAVIRFQEVNAVMADGAIGQETMNLLFSNNAKRNPIDAQVKIPIGPTTSSAPEKFGTLADWFTQVNEALSVGSSFLITDMQTGTKFRMARTGGTNHADMKASSQDAQASFLEVFGGVANWSKRPVTVLIGGTEVAASLQGMPHGEDGSVCLYFQNSTSDVFNLVDEEHRRIILRASGTNW